MKMQALMPQTRHALGVPFAVAGNTAQVLDVTDCLTVCKCLSKRGTLDRPRRGDSSQWPFERQGFANFCNTNAAAASLAPDCRTHSRLLAAPAAAMSGKGAKGLSGKGAKGTITGKQKLVDDKKKPISRSARAGLQFPVGRIHRLLKVSVSRLSC